MNIKHAGVNPRQNFMRAGDDWNATFKIKATGENNTIYLVDVNFSSDYSASDVQNNDTDDITVCIGECPSVIISGASIW